MEKQNAKVIRQNCIAPDIFDLWLYCPDIVQEMHPGQFVNVFVRDASKLLPRPISICEINASTGELRLVYRITSERAGTKQISLLREGDELDILGPLGHGFPLSIEEMAWDELHKALEAETDVLLVGGGIGIPPMLGVAKAFKGKCKVILGYRDRDTFLAEDFRKICSEVYIATEDGSVGTKGNVWQCILEHELNAKALFACGPNPMLLALKKEAPKRGMRTYLSLESRMACGIGACLACVAPSPHIHEKMNVGSVRVCKEGPVFVAEEIDESYF